MRIETFKLYPDREDVTLTAYILDDSHEILNGKPRGGVIVCPGGAYLTCSDREAEPIAMQFTAMGYHAFILCYSVQDENGAARQEMFEKGLQVKQKLLHPAPVLELGMSFKLIHDHAAEWLVNTEKLAVCGFSAGGHNAAMYAAFWNTDMVRGALGYGEDVLRPAAAILGYPLTDFAAVDTSKLAESAAGLYPIMYLTFTGTKEPSAEVLDEISPARHITSDTPASFIWSTAADGLVPVQQALAWAKGCADAKVPFEIHVYENGDHGLGLGDHTTAGAKNQLSSEVSQWIVSCKDFLCRRFAVELPDAPTQN